MYAVTGTLAPSYASGAHAWKGTIAAFRKNATTTSTTAACAIVFGDPSAWLNAVSASVPVPP